MVGGDPNIGDVLGSQIDESHHARAALAADRKRLIKELNMQRSVDAD